VAAGEAAVPRNGNGRHNDNARGRKKEEGGEKE